jgi:hypothetical protein
LLLVRHYTADPFDRWKGSLVRRPEQSCGETHLPRELALRTIAAAKSPVWHVERDQGILFRLQGFIGARNRTAE